MAGRALHLAGNVAGLAAGLITAPLTARSLGPDGRGEVAIVIVISTILMTVAAFGVPWLARSELARDPTALGFWRRYAQLVGFALVPVAVGVGIGLGSLMQLSADKLIAVSVLFVLGVFAAARGIEANALITMGRPSQFGLANIASAATTVVVIVVTFVTGSLSVLVVLCTSIVSIVVQVGITVLLVRRATQHLGQEMIARSRELRLLDDYRGTRLVGRASRAWSAQVGEAVATRGDTATVASLAPAVQVGLYSVVALIPQAAFAVFTTVVQASYSRPRHGDEIVRFVHVFQACVTLAVAIAVLAAPAAWWAVPVVFGADFEPARDYLPAALAMTLALGASAPVIQRMSSGRAPVWPLFVILSVVAATTVVLSFFAPPPVVVLALAAVLFVAALVYALLVTRGAVARVNIGQSRRWWRAENTDG